MRITIAAGLSLALLSAGCSKPLAPDQFLTKALQGDNSEITLGGIAAAKGGSAVKSYGETLIADHTVARASAMEVAQAHGVAIPSDLLPEAAKEQAKLNGLSGTDFDKEFVRYMIEDHKGDISDFEKEAKSDAPADVKALATDTLPHLRNHLALAQRLT